ncbi:MAG: Peptidyl-prolyl cis-trans isomerase fpr2 [Sporothrix thermara]
MAGQNTSDIPVDKSPISPAHPDSQVRRNSLEHYLQNRPHREELVQNSTAAPGLQAQQKQLEKSMRVDSLNDKISNRPSPEELIKKGVLDEDPRSPEEKTLTVPPEYGYGQRGVGPIPAGSTLIFETELLGIHGVPKPETIVTKSVTGTPAEAISSTATEAESANIAEKIASKVAEAADAVKTIVADTDDSQEHNEL